MKKYLDISGKYIYKEKGKKLGFIENAVLNYKMRKITSYIVLSEGIIPKVFIIPLKDIHYNKEDMFIKKEPVPYKKRIINKNIKYTTKGIIEREIVNKDNKPIGEIEDILLDHVTGNIKAFICKRGFYDDLVRGKKVILSNKNLEITSEKITANEGSIEIISEISFTNDFEEDE